MSAAHAQRHPAASMSSSRRGSKASTAALGRRRLGGGGWPPFGRLRRALPPEGAPRPRSRASRRASGPRDRALRTCSACSGSSRSDDGLTASIPTRACSRSRSSSLAIRRAVRLSTLTTLSSSRSWTRTVRSCSSIRARSSSSLGGGCGPRRGWLGSSASGIMRVSSSPAREHTCAWSPRPPPGRSPRSRLPRRAARARWAPFASGIATSRPRASRAGAVHSTSRSTAAAVGISSRRSKSISLPSIPCRIARQRFSSISRWRSGSTSRPSS